MNKFFVSTCIGTLMTIPIMAQDVTGTIHTDQGHQKIYKEVYGQFESTCLKMARWVFCR